MGALAKFAKREVMDCQVAVTAIAAMLIEGNPHASRLMKNLLTMSPGLDAVRALEEISAVKKVLTAVSKESQASERGTETFVKALSWAVQGIGVGSLRSSATSGVRGLALRFCAKLTKRGDRDMIGVYRAHCKDPEADVRAAVAEGLGKTLTDYSPGLFEGILPLANDREAKVREAALKSLTCVKCYPRNLPVLVSATVPLLGDTDPGVRFAALEALSEFARQGDDTAAAAVARLPDDFE